MRTGTALILVAIVFLAFGAIRVITGSGGEPRVDAPPEMRAQSMSAAPEPPSSPQRIVSMAPSITETLFALGLGDRVVGVTRYCDYPREAETKAEVGGFVDPNYEAIVALKPDLVVLLVIHEDARKRLSQLEIRALQVDHRTVDGILESFERIGGVCDVEAAAQALIRSCRERMAAIAAKTEGLDRPRVLLSSARALGSGRIDSVYVAGHGQWYNELIRLAGGENAYPDDGIAFPEVSGEGLLRLDPDVIVEMVPKLDEASYTKQDIIDEWKTVPGLRAVQEGRVYVLGGDYVSVPGPRYVDVLEDLARILHPEVDWDAP